MKIRISTKQQKAGQNTYSTEPKITSSDGNFSETVHMQIRNRKRNLMTVMNEKQLDLALGDNLKLGLPLDSFVQRHC